MNKNKLRNIRNILRITFSVLFCWLYFPHLFCYFLNGKARALTNKDIRRMCAQNGLNVPLLIGLLFFLHSDRYYRVVFYHRIGPVAKALIGWYRPGDRYFIIPPSVKIGGGIFVAHPYSTVLNAESIGENFTCIHCTTIGKKGGKRAIIGDNVTLGAHSCVIGGVRIGNNVQIGAGTVVVKDIPNNSVVVGDPSRIIKQTAL